MAAFTIDETAQFVCVLTFNLAPGTEPALAGEIQRSAESLAPTQKGFVGAVVMLNAERSRLLVLSIWDSAHAWSAAQYDEKIGKVVSDVVKGASSYDIATYETVALVRN